jgi:hypothetical protein
MSRRLLLATVIAVACLVELPPASAQGSALSGEAPQVKVGDSWRWVRSDRRTGVKEAETTRTITSVTAQRIEASEDAGPAVFTADMSALETAAWVRSEPARFADFPLAVGKKWSFKFTQTGKTSRYATRSQYDAEVVGTEKVKTPAGEFDTFKVVSKGFWNSETSSRSGRAAVTIWYAPAVRTSVRTEFEDGTNYNVTELVEVKLAP